MNAPGGWGELSAVVIAVAAVLTLFTTITNSIVGDVEDDVAVLRDEFLAHRQEMDQFRQEFNEFKLSSSVSQQRMELLLQQVVHGPDMESPERIASND